MFGQSLKSESPEAQSHRVQQSDLIQDGQESSVQRNQICESQIQSSNSIPIICRDSLFSYTTINAWNVIKHKNTSSTLDQKTTQLKQTK